ncbi:ArsR/SmtB family transcription factor [Ornithinimicrobium murale]|uniref:ArsR/SmtB family transcription factor n=1 Tax=Ornithinimicrobium murale TaxID=1050153 RepID=UPI000E0CCDB6|nr:metalloregulator ArsR/SmtB family transcription factor [Ornithinimicrobium murale]
MGDRSSKQGLLAEFATVGKALGHPARLELVDLLSQGSRSVEHLAAEAALAMSTCSTHLQLLREAGLVQAHREGKRVYYSLTGDDVATLWDQLRTVAEAHRPQTGHAARVYLGPADTEVIGTDELRDRLERGDALVLDVRPEAEYAAGHLPGALHIPLGDLADRLGELPADQEIIAYCRGRYCVLAHDAVRLLTASGHDARRTSDGVLEWRLAGLPLVTDAA